jgi:thiosulfate reductase cytochrome b subunit
MHSILRHRLSTRIWHWLNVLAVFALLMSGLMIFNAHPRLYWGEYGANPDPAILEIGSTESRGFLRIGNLDMTTTGVLGHWRDANGNTQRWAFPGWATIPSTYDLAMGRRWHFFFAWAFVFLLVFHLVSSVVNGHVRKDLAPARAELKPGHLWREILRHARLRFAKGAHALHYNTLQKLAYLSLLFLLLPLIVLTGLAMSPSLDAALPWLPDLFGGRQSARTVHFAAAFFLVLFVVVHVVMVLLAGPVNGIRSMITGRYRVPKESTP